MTQKCQSCGSCGMPLLRPEDHASGDETSELCCYCVREDGTPKNYQEVLKGMAEYFIQSQGITQEAAQKIAYQVMDNLPYWTLKEKGMMKCTPLSISINRSFEEAFRFISNPENIPLYSGFVKKIVKQGDVWMGETSEGTLPHRIVVNEQFGIFDIAVTEPSGFELQICSRLIANGKGCEYVTAIYQPPMIDDKVYQEWIGKVQLELLRMKQLIERL